MLGAPSILLFSLALGGIGEDLQACKAKVRSAPGDYDAARCFHLAAQRHAKSADLADPARQKTLEALNSLEQEFAAARYLDIVRGHLYWGGDPQKATSIYQRAALRYDQLDDALGAVVAHANAGQLLFWRFRRNAEAQREMDAVLRIAKRVKDPQVKARASVLLASYACDVGDRIGKALELLKSFGPEQIDKSPYSLQREILVSRTTCAMYYLDYEQLERDLKSLSRLAEEHQDTETQVMAMYRWAFAGLHQLDVDPTSRAARAKEVMARFEQALALAKSADEIEFVVRSLSSMATLAVGDPQGSGAALDLAKRCYAVIEASKRPDLFPFCAYAKIQALREQDPAQAYDLAVDALEKLPADSTDRIRTKILRAAMRRSWAVNPPKESFGVANRFLEAIELDREAQPGSIARQRIFAAWSHDYYWLSSRLFELGQSDPGYIESAFQVSERSRARVLLEQMSQRLLNPKGNEAADAMSKNALRELRRLEQLSLGQSSQLGAYSDPETDTPSKRVELSLARVQELLSPKEAMVLYQTAPDQTFDGETLGGTWALVISKDKAQAIKLDAELFTLRNAVSILRDLLRRKDPGLATARSALRKLIMDPVVSALGPGVSSLIVVPDGPLHALAFTSIAPEYEYSVAPSAAVWSEIRSSHGPKLEPLGLSLVNPLRANPDIDDSSGVDTPASQQELRPLPESQREAAAIRRFLGTEVQVLQGKEATPAELMSSWGPKHRLLHISAHSRLNLEVPNESALLLSNPEPGADGRLSVSKIQAMRAKDAVVVLAGCATGWGSLLAGEGMLSLARAFQEAGATAVVASLWPIRDDIAAEFFERFYQELGQGMPVARALKLARAQMKQDGHPESNYEGFVVLGDGSVRFSVPMAARLRQWLPGGVLGLLSVLGLWWWVKRRRVAASQ